MKFLNILYNLHNNIYMKVFDVKRLTDLISRCTRQASDKNRQHRISGKRHPVDNLSFRVDTAAN